MHCQQNIKKDCVNVTDIYFFQMEDHPLNKQSILTIIEKL